MITQVIPIQHAISNTADFNTDPPTDFSAWDIVVMTVRVEALTGTPTTASLFIKAQTRDPWDVTVDVWQDIPGFVTPTVRETDTLQIVQTLRLVKGVDFDKYLRFYGDTTFSGGSTPGWTLTLNLTVHAYK